MVFLADVRSLAQRLLGLYPPLKWKMSSFPSRFLFNGHFSETLNLAFPCNLELLL